MGKVDGFQLELTCLREQYCTGCMTEMTKDYFDDSSM